MAIMKIAVCGGRFRGKRYGASFLLLAAALAVSACGRDGGQAPPGGAMGGNLPPPEVSVSVVEQRRVAGTVEITGRIAAVDEVEVRPRVNGYLQSIHFREGAVVEKGALLFVIDPRPYQADHDQARAAEESARARLELATNEFGRAERLHESHTISDDDLDRKRSELQQARADVAASQARLTGAQLNLEFTRVTAPITGRIGRHVVSEGNLVNGPAMGTATLLATLVAQDPVYVYFAADEKTLVDFKTRQAGKAAQPRLPVEVAVAGDSGFPHRGHLDFIDNVVDRQTGTFSGRAVIANPKGILTPGMFARVRLPVSEPRDALLVSESAIASDQNNRYVLAVNAQNMAEYRRVTLGAAQDGLRVVASGLNAGDRIIVNGLQRVRPGMPVMPREVPMPAAGDVTASPVTSAAH